MASELGSSGRTTASSGFRGISSVRAVYGAYSVFHDRLTPLTLSSNRALKNAFLSAVPKVLLNDAILGDSFV